MSQFTTSRDKKMTYEFQNPMVAEEEYEDEDDGYCGCEQCFSNWANKITINAVLTRERLDFLRDIWDILEDIDCALNNFDFQVYNRDLRDILCTNKGQLMLKTFPEFRFEIENEIYTHAINGANQWEVWWQDVFGCEMEDARYWT